MNQDTRTAAALLRDADAVLISASNGLSIAEGYHIFADNADFRKYFGSFRNKYGIDCLIRGVFAQIPEHDEYMATVHRYLIDNYKGSRVMKNLLTLVAGKDYFVVTSNADTHFQMNGFDPERIFEVEGNFDGMDMYSRKWTEQRERFGTFANASADKNVVVLELGIGKHNTMIKKPLMNMVAAHPTWTFVTLNLPQEIYVPANIASRAVALPGDIAETFEELLREEKR